MARQRDARRGTDGPLGTTAMLLVAASDPVAAIELSAACRDALRETDAVLAREDAGVISILLRGLRAETDDAAVVERRVRAACEQLVGSVLTGLAVSSDADEPLDLLLRRAHESLAGEHPGSETLTKARR